jgi:uncharacterized membrane protein
MTLDDKLESLIKELTLPSTEMLKPWLKHLAASPGSCVIIAIELPLETNTPRVAYAWLSESERVSVRKALRNVNKSRAQQGQPSTATQPID